MSRPITAPHRFSLTLAFAVVAAVFLAETAATWLAGGLYEWEAFTELFSKAGDDPAIEATLLIGAKLLATALVVA
ncbi:MAG: hypothetical protein FJ399_04450, partial [Verrucomicrobia bacterium]|nr:hypothetical protein [Verrucomicrobiota bacterium]